MPRPAAQALRAPHHTLRVCPAACACAPPLQQEPGDDRTIKEFISDTFGVTFPVRLATVTSPPSQPGVRAGSAKGSHEFARVNHSACGFPGAVLRCPLQRPCACPGSACPRR